jgi:hypothetical protein
MSKTFSGFVSLTPISYFIERNIRRYLKKLYVFATSSEKTMVRINFQEQPQRAKRTYIDLPETIYAYDIIADKKAKNEPIPSAISQFLNRYNFYLAPVPVSAGINYNARGAKWISLKGQFASGVTAEDNGPKTEWIKAGEFEVNFGINFSTVGKLLELVNLPNPVDGILFPTCLDTTKLSSLSIKL